MKIDFILRNHDDTPSGGRKVIYSYANYLADKGHTVTIWFLGDTPFYSRHANLFKQILHWIHYVRSVKNQEEITWFRLNPKVMIKSGFHLPKNFTNKNGCVVAFDYGISLYLYEHYPTLRNNLIHFIQADERIYDAADIVESAWRLPIHKVVVSLWLKQLLSAYNNDISLVPNYLEKEKFYLESPIEQRDYTVSLLNHASPSKGTSEGLAVINLAKKQIPNLRVIMFGNGNRPETLSDNDQYFQMATPQQLRQQVYNQSAIYLQMSHSEGWGLTATEAMACGCTLLSTNNGGISDFAKDKYSALIVSVGDITEAAKKLVYLLSHQKERVRIASNGLKSVSQYTFKNSAAAFEEILDRIGSGL